MLDQERDLNQKIAGLTSTHTIYQEEKKNLQTWQDAVRVEQDNFDRINNNTINKLNELNGLKEGVDKLKDETASLEAKELKLKEIETAIRERKAAETEKKDLEGEISELKRDADALRLSVAKLEQAEKTTKENQTVVDNLEGTKTILNGRIQELDSEIGRKVREKQEYESSVRVLIEEEIAYQNKKGLHEKFNKSIQELDVEKNDLQKQIIQKENHLKRLQDAVEEQEKDKVLQDTGEAIQQLIQGLAEFTEQLREQAQTVPSGQNPPSKNPDDPDGEGAGSTTEGGN